MAGAEIDVPVIAPEIVETMWIHNTAGQRRKIVIEGFDGFLGVGVSCAEQIADQFLFLGVHAEGGVASFFVFGSEPGDVLELAIAIRMLFVGSLFQGFASSCTFRENIEETVLTPDAEG